MVLPQDSRATRMRDAHKPIPLAETGHRPRLKQLATSRKVRPVAKAGPLGGCRPRLRTPTPLGNTPFSTGFPIFKRRTDKRHVVHRASAKQHAFLEDVCPFGPMASQKACC